MEQNRFRHRLWFVVLGVLVAATYVGYTLYDLQYVRAAELKQRAERQQQDQVEIAGGRGAILDRNGHELAVSVETESLYVHPYRLTDDDLRRRAARQIAEVLDVPTHKVASKLKSDKPFVWIQRRLDPKVAAQIRGLDLPVGPAGAFHFKREPKRVYPLGSTAAHVLGFANIDQKGVEGIELLFDDRLQGDPETHLAMRDGAGGRVMQLIQAPTQQPEDLILTLDVVLQHAVERELERAMRETGARAASAVLLDPTTGEVLALANRPTANPNRYGNSTAADRRNRAVVDSYEPGSTFKIVTTAAALDQGTIRPGQRFDCENGEMRTGGGVVRDHKRFGILTVSEILQNSSNIGVMKINRTLEPEIFLDYVQRFGFGTRSGIELPGEQRGIVHPVARWSSRTGDTMAFGQEVGVTVLQMASAFATVANDGMRVEPRIALGHRDADGFHRFPEPPSKQVIAPDVARRLSHMLELVVADGTGHNAAIDGYSIAGKTGTAQISGPGGYSKTDYVASFGGFAPVHAPAVAGIVTLDTPEGERHQGGQVAAPVFRRILATALPHLRAARDEGVLAVDPNRDDEPLRANWVRERRPRKIPAGSADSLPDVRGLPLRSAIARLAASGCRPEVIGSGTVTAQQPAPGDALGPEGRCVVRAERRS